MAKVPTPEAADIETSSEGYARRFAGPVGEWFLELQARSTLGLLGAVSRGSRVLDVGGGHAQLTPPLLEAGYEVVVLGSDEACAERLAPWLSQDRCRFEIGNLLALPYPDRSFAAVLSFRLLPHLTAWRRLVAELCRTARDVVIVDYPSIRSINVFADGLFAAKKRIEKNTRPFTLFHPREIGEAFAENGFRLSASRPQFLWPMVLHRMLGRPMISRALEAPGRVLGLTRLLGSPVIVRLERDHG
jgi:SAM-dependent methyltransferase